MASDLDKAREIVRANAPFVGAMGTMEEKIAKAVAQGIAWGRQQEAAKAQKEGPKDA